MALARFGRRCPPIAVTSGWPNSAVILLLQKLSAAGSRLHYHGDFDGEGLRIAAAVVARTGASAVAHDQRRLPARGERTARRWAG